LELRAWLLGRGGDGVVAGRLESFRQENERAMARTTAKIQRSIIWKISFDLSTESCTNMSENS
jgi:hypothetical protein